MIMRAVCIGGQRPAFSRYSDLNVFVDRNDDANWADVADMVSMWDCEIPLTDEES